jgi:hypothetical protein
LPKAATKRAAKPAPKHARTAAKPARAAAKPVPRAKPDGKIAPGANASGASASGASASAAATRLAAEIEQSLASGRTDVLTPAALHALMGAACKAYAAQVEAGNPASALSARTSVTPTEVMITASGLLRAANLAVFELGMWQSWTGR